MKKEIWKSISGYKGLYEVSNMGRVKSTCNRRNCHYRTGDVLKQYEDGHGYLTVGLHKNNKGKLFRIHCLVLLTFVSSRPKGKESSHLNDIKTDNYLENLAWMTPSENIKLSYVNGRKSWLLGCKGKNHPMFGRHLSKETRRKMSIAKIGNQNARRQSNGKNKN